VTEIAPPSVEAGTRSARWLVAPLLAFACVAVVTGVVARWQVGGDRGTYFDLFFSDPIHMKTWLATTAIALALFQLMTASWIFRKLPWPRPAWVPPLHRWSGRIAFLLTLPIAYHCIFRLGFQEGTARTLAHSLAGASVYGAFASKILIVRLHRFPGWVLPAAGGFLFAALIAVWYSSALWFLDLVGAEL
jgi:uncharacterized protein DUF6529